MPIFFSKIFKSPIVYFLIGFALYRNLFVKSLKLDDSNSNISDEQAKQYANDLFGAMDYETLGVFGGTNEAVIISIFNKITSDDFKKIFNFFGQKAYAVAGHVYDPFNLFGKDLVHWLNAEINLNSSKYLKVKSIIDDAGFTV